MAKEGEDIGATWSSQNPTRKVTKLAGMSDEDWEELDLKVISTIRLCLANEVMYNVMNEETTTSLWLRLEILYMTKSLSNKLYLKKNNYMGYT